MNSIKQSIWYLLIYNKIFVGILLIYIIFTMTMNLILMISYASASGYPSLMIQLFLFLGVYLGGSLSRLKRNYLWKNNKHYKNSILHAYFIIIAFVTCCFMPFLWTYAKISTLVLIMPISISVFASYLVLGKNLFYKILIPAVPIALFQLSSMGLGLNFILALILLATMILITLMYKDIFYTYTQHQKTAEQVNANNIAFMTTGLSHKHLDKINGFIGLYISQWIISGTKKIEWAVLMPHTRLAIITLLYSLVLLLFMSIIDVQIQNMVGLFALMLLPNIFLGFVMESKNLLKQVKFFAHVFTGDKHRQLKNKVLFALDKNMLFNASVFVGMLLLIIQLLSINIPMKPLFLSLSVVLLISMAIVPLLMCLNWLNISPLLMGILVVYAWVLYTVIKWIYANALMEISVVYSVSFISLCIGLRIVTQTIFWRTSIENLLNNR
ncbi:MAG: hypothetical protein AB8B80_00710 [Marinicellaceae bacterium]